MDLDLKLALKLDRELNGSNSSPVPAKKFKKSSPKKETSIINPEWEITDPNPDIHMLFQVFDKKYFWGRLDCVEVKWSPRMYSCAGICTYKGKLGGCVISLSLPLLKFRPRKDLIETLLHEMIHAFLFVADKNRDRGEHGPKFHAHMNRINKEAGTKISVYHSFHDEVKHYKQHWWRCNGPCQEWKPFFGLVKRSMNRAPGPNDFWFADHKSKCGGEFIKIKEPENFKSRKSKKKAEKTKEIIKGPSTPITNFYPQVPKKGPLPSKSESLPSKNTGNKSKPTSVINTLQNNNTSAKTESYNKISNVHGFTNLSKPCQSTQNSGNQSTPKGTSGFVGLKSNKGGTLLENPKPSTSQKTDKKEENTEKIPPPKSDFIAFSGSGHKLSSSGPIPSLAESRAKFLEKFSTKSSASSSKAKRSSNGLQKPEDSSLNQELASVNVDSDSDDEIEFSEVCKNLVHCPVCNKEMEEHAMNEHLDSCATLVSVFEQSDYADLSKDLDPEDESTLTSDLVNCPSCGFTCSEGEINDHLDSCLS